MEEAIQKKKYKIRDMVRVLAKSIKENKRPTVWAILFIGLESIIECIIPFVMKMLIDTMTSFENVANNKDLMPQVLMYGGILIAMALVSFLCGVLAARFSAKAAVGFGTNLRRDLFSKIMTFSFNNIDKFSVASLVTRLTADVWFIQMAYMMLIRAALRSPMMLIFSIVMASIQSYELSWVFAITIPILAGGLVIIMIAAIPLFNRLFKRYDDLNESVEENVRGIRVVKTFVREEYEKEKMGKASDNLRRGFTKAERIVAANSPIMSFCMYLSMFLIVFFGSMIIRDTALVNDKGELIFTTLGVGDLSTLLTYGAQILMSLMMLSMVLVMFTMSAASMRRTYEVLTEESTIQEIEDRLYEIKDGSISFKDVNFKYSEQAERYALSNINLDIKSGETIGIIGATGSSKSTLVNLVSRFYDTTTGEVLVGGRNVKEYDITALRNNVSMVLQKNVLFSGTIEENLRWGNENATDEEIKEACKIAQADSFVESFPDKYKTMIQQGGTNVSGGQKQRLCIARAILKKPKILILDDSTSAVDTKTDAFIREGLKTTLPNTTKIIIAQRISSVQEADRIIVMNEGQINGIGSHEELMKSNQIYREIYDIQNKIGGAH